MLLQSSYIKEKVFVAASIIYSYGYYFCYENVRRTMRTAVVSNLKPHFLHANSSTQNLSQLQFDSESNFLLKIHISFYCQYAKFSNAAKGPQSVVSEICRLVPFLCFQSLDVTILSKHKNASKMLCLVMKILTEKIIRYLGITHFSLAAIFYFSFPNIFKIKDKILLTFSVESQNGQLISLKY